MKKIAIEQNLNLTVRADFERAESLAKQSVEIAFGLKNSGKITFSKLSLSDLAAAGGITVQELQRKFPNMSVGEILLYLDLISVYNWPLPKRNDQTNRRAA
jgi:hypothetical protein